MYCLIFDTIFKSCPKLMTYLISKTWVITSFKISSKVFYGVIVYGVNWIGCLLVISWLIGYSKLTQFKWSGMFKLMNACDVESFPNNSLMVWTKESLVENPPLLQLCFNYCSTTNKVKNYTYSCNFFFKPLTNNVKKYKLRMKL